MNPINDSRNEQVPVSAVVGKINCREQSPLTTELAKVGVQEKHPEPQNAGLECNPKYPAVREKLVWSGAECKI